MTTSQRTLLELLADEFKDPNAKRIMNVSQYAKEAAEKEKDAVSGIPHQYDADSEHHHGFLRKIWEKLTHHEKKNDDSK